MPSFCVKPSTWLVEDTSGWLVKLHGLLRCIFDPSGRSLVVQIQTRTHAVYLIHHLIHEHAEAEKQTVFYPLVYVKVSTITPTAN